MHIESLADASPLPPFSVHLKNIYTSHNLLQSKPFAGFIHINLYFVTLTPGLCLDNCTFTALVGGKCLGHWAVFTVVKLWRKWGVCFPHLYYLFIYFCNFYLFVDAIKMTQHQVRLCLLVLQAIVVSRKHEIRERPCFTVASESKWRRAEEVVYYKILFLIYFFLIETLRCIFKK